MCKYMQLSPTESDIYRSLEIFHVKNIRVKNFRTL